MKRLAVLIALLLCLTTLSIVKGAAADITVDVDTLGAFRWDADIETALVTANVDIRPETLQVKSGGESITAFIALPPGYDPNQIDIETLVLGYDLNGDGTIGAGEFVGADGTRGFGSEGTLRVAFDRVQVVALVESLVYLQDVNLTVTGQVGTSRFSGVDTIRLQD
jgi:hypothetical protein